MIMKCIQQIFAPLGPAPLRPFSGTGALYVGPIRPICITVACGGVVIPTPTAPREQTEIIPHVAREQFYIPPGKVNIVEPASTLIFALSVAVLFAVKGTRHK